MGGYYPSNVPLPTGDDIPPPHFYNTLPLLPDPPNLSTANLARWFDLDSNNSATVPRSAARSRRRIPPGADHVKHRRTRSGCYTCRSRRVKCDETHPVCKRCAKGSRDCNYPEPLSASKSTSGSKSSQTHDTIPEDDGSSSEEYDEDDTEISSITAQGASESLHTQIPQPSGSNPRSTSQKQSLQNIGQAFAAPASISKLKEKSLSPSADDSSAFSKSRSNSTTFDSLGQTSSVSPGASQELPQWSHLDREIQRLLHYHQTHLTYHHYFFKHGGTHFVHTTLLETALEYKPLLYALVGFAAFHETTKKPNGKIGDFLEWYNRSVTKLLKYLKGGRKHNEATLLTILQLAAFEEYLGDWVNLLSHQKAAYEMLLEIYTPETIMQTETSRKILGWYTRFDIFAGLMSGDKTVLSREWIAASEVFYTSLANNEPSNLDYQIESNIAMHRLIAIDMTLLFARLPRGDISMADFHVENDLVARRICNLQQQLAPLLAKDEYRVWTFDEAAERDPNDIVDPYVPGLLFHGPLFTINYIKINWYAIETMHRYQTSAILQQPPPPDLYRLALEQCRLLEAIEYWSGSPAGAVLPAQASLAMNCLFLPRDEKHIMWCRRKLAKIESMGYIYPSSFRTKIAELWNLPEIEHWWLPHEEGYPPIIKSIRAFIEERTRAPRDQGSEDVRNIKGMFAKLGVDDTSPKDSPESSSSVGAGAGFSAPAAYEQVPSFEKGGDRWFDARMDDASWEGGAEQTYYLPPR
ncbi:hypothetical protein MMC26_003842 [Xylographa opegraphella]|nr:hypothetical protein [Xylographa opegraphella]